MRCSPCLLLMTALVLGASLVLGVKQQQESFNVDSVLNNPRVLNAYLKCVLGTGPCTKEGREMKIGKKENEDGPVETKCNINNQEHPTTQHNNDLESTNQDVEFEDQPLSNTASNNNNETEAPTTSKDSKMEPLFDITNMPIVFESPEEITKSGGEEYFVNNLDVEDDADDPLPLYCLEEIDANFLGQENEVNDILSADDESKTTNDSPNNSQIIDENQVQDEEENVVMHGRPKKGRKRKYQEQTRSSRKVFKNSNMPYINQRGIPVESKPFTDYQRCKCKCYTKVDVESRKIEFMKFWELGHYEAQNAYLCANIKEEETKRKRNINSEKRKYTRTYCIAGNVVCREMFINSFKISTKRINTALCKMRSKSLKDKRGAHGGYNVLTEEKINEIINHIKKIPTYKSHYARSTSDSCYLPTNMTASVMYEAYKSEVENPVSFASYKKIFYEKFNLKRKPLKKDTCSVCDVFYAKIQSTNNHEEKEKLNNEHDAHLLKAENAREMLKQDIKKAKENPSIETLTFDLEKTLPLPKIPTNVAYYKRQLMFYNSGIHSGKEDKGYFYTWTEGTAGRGAQEVGSCLVKHITEECPNIKELILWSDSCGGQNRNIKITLMLKHLLENHPTLKLVTLNYFVPGHSFMPNDSDFGDVECALKLQQRIYTPDDYRNIMRHCRKKNPFVVKVMDSQDFYSTKELEQGIVNRKVDSESNKINWFQIRTIDLNKDHPYSMFFETELNKLVENVPTVKQFREIDLKKKKPGRQSTNLFSNSLQILWPTGKPISVEKLNDIKSMLPLIPSDAKRFYKNFTASDEIEDDIDGFNGVVDFEIEPNLG